MKLAFVPSIKDDASLLPAASDSVAPAVQHVISVLNLLAPENQANDKTDLVIVYRLLRYCWLQIWLTLTDVQQVRVLLKEKAAWYQVHYPYTAVAETLVTSVDSIDRLIGIIQTRNERKLLPGAIEAD